MGLPTLLIDIGVADGHPLLHIKRDQFSVFALSETFGEFLTDYLINGAFCVVHNVQQACTSLLVSRSSTPKTCVVSSLGDLCVGVWD